jgi:very-short-patch-repair endonuclease
VWRRERLVVELDGRAFHDTAAAFERDRVRDRSLIAQGWRVIRVTWRQLVRSPERLARDLWLALSARPPHELHVDHAIRDKRDARREWPGAGAARSTLTTA